MSRKLGKEELMDLIEGATLLGAGGGGSPESALKMLDEIFKKKDFIEIVSPEEISDNARIVATAEMGSPAVWLKEEWKKGEKLYALEKMEKLLGKINYVVPLFIGAFAFAGASYVSATKDILLIDGDGAGKGVPEVEQTSFYLGGIPLGPMCLTDREGNSAILYSRNFSIGLDMARAICAVYGSSASAVCYPMNGKQLKATVIPNTLSFSEKVGRALREAREEKTDVVEAALKAVDGYLLAKGKVKKKTEEIKATYDIGKVKLEGIVVEYMYENIIAWKGNKPIAMFPDLMCWLGLDGRPLTNADLKEGMEVALIGKKAHEKWRTIEGLILSTSYLKILGCKEEYKPIEELIK
jgi:hypothetical protein